MEGWDFLNRQERESKSLLSLYPANYDFFNNAKKKLEFSIC